MSDQAPMDAEFIHRFVDHITCECGYRLGYECSACGPIYSFTNFCPKCGADIPAAKTEAPEQISVDKYTYLDDMKYYATRFVEIGEGDSGHRKYQRIKSAVHRRNNKQDGKEYIIRKITEHGRRGA